jgi:sulfate-transporting ATPase
MAGVEKDFMGKAELKKGATLGYLPQEPRLDSSKTVREEVEEAFADIKKMLADYDKVSDSMGGDLSRKKWKKPWRKWAACKSRSKRWTGGT